MAKLKQIDKAFTNAVRSTVNKLLRKGRVAASKKVREVYNIKAGDLKKHTIVKRASNSNPVGTIRVRGKRMHLISFGAKQNKRGVSVMVKKKGSRKTIRHAFISPAQKQGANLFVWQRKGKERHPRRALKTLAAAQMFEYEGAAEFNKLVQKEGGQLLQKEVDHYLLRLGK